MKTVLLYAGQGSQKVGMGKDFYEEFSLYRNFIDNLNEGVDAVSVNIKELMHEGPLEELSKTENTQACMAAYAAGVTMLLKETGVEFEAACGLSLGEYGALYASGVFSAEDYVKLTAFRGKKMMEAAKGCSCQMSAVLGLDSDIICKLVNEYEGEGFVTVANYNCPGQTVICGDDVPVADMEKILIENGAKRCVRLNVSGPFHTKYMAPAGEALKGYFENMIFNKPEIPVALNVTGEFANEDSDLKELLIRQVQSSVYLEKDLRTLIEAGYRDFTEIGPGNTLAGFMKKTAKAMGVEVTVRSIETVEDFKKAVEVLK